MSCVFCKIIAGEIPSKKLYEDDDFIIIADIDPKAKLHYLAIPKSHYADFDSMTEADAQNLQNIFKKLPLLKERLGLSGGYRVIINQGADAGQTVFHLHIHLLGGQNLPFDDLKSRG